MAKYKYMMRVENTIENLELSKPHGPVVNAQQKDPKLHSLTGDASRILLKDRSQDSKREVCAKPDSPGC
jgi:hypothetical protein